MIRLIVARNDFAKIGAELAPKVSATVITTALEVEAQAKQMAPVKTGNLRRSIGTQPVDAFHALVGTDVEYAPFQEYGTRHMAAHPYLTPAIEGARIRFVARLKKVFSRG